MNLLDKGIEELSKLLSLTSIYYFFGGVVKVIIISKLLNFLTN